ncbi:GntR domain protein [Alkaliphilus metalliredigens QYMF]|uniref:GntR domain protein n=1 Tax=Alkaliphilus metalliredigens (strain QYMF) TaxID=293826 RepID=A6TLH5_ALKMQ|nr:FadR/GntR family transcriptional regulator [Alkaliphilus metalliredigens]ABR47043.1 GntR domain protein [Alkaliphilus metalliredigens QYMF]
MFRPIKSTKVYEQVAEQIQDMIVNGELQKGDKLPSERHLAEELQVSRASIREALRALQIIGLIDVRQGEGSYINHSFEKCLFQPLSIMFMLQQSKPEEIIELRKIIEVEAAYLAAKRADDEEIEQLRSLIEQLKILKDLDDEETSVSVDKQFHYLIAKSSKNQLLVNVLNVISELMDKFIKDARGMILIREENKEVLINQHEAIFKGLENRDPDATAGAMQAHIKFIMKEYLNSPVA